jgi:ribosomal protein S6--L-glutamate ligase
VPPSCIAAGSEAAEQILGGLPIIVKPVRGTSGRGIEIVSVPEDHARIGRGPHFVQKFDRINDDDLKVYVIGDHVSIVRRPFPARTLQDKLGTPYEDRDVAAMALKIGQLFGLELYGIDVVETRSGPVVVDVNACPGFVGCEGAGRRLADYIDHALRSGASARARGHLKVVGE